jgi:ABC-type multidrug transport system fused ATPase/permease subunit
MEFTKWTFIELIKLFRKCLNLLNSRDQGFVVLYAFLQYILILLDLAGILLIGAIAAIATSSIQGTELPKIIESLLEFFLIQDSSSQIISLILGISAAFLLSIKSLLSYYIGLRSFSFLARRETQISSSLAKRVFNQDITDLNRFSTPQYQHAMTNGSASVMGGVIGQSLSLLSELFLQIIMLSTLFFFSPLLTVISLTLFLSLFIILNKYQGEKAKKWGSGLARADVESTSLISHAIGSYREIVVGGRRSFFIDRIKLSREEAAHYLVNKTMLTQFSKYAFEMSVILSGLAISAFAFLTKPAIQAASLIIVFIAASTRIAPSVLKLQQGVIQLRGAAGATELFFEIYDSLIESHEYEESPRGQQKSDFDLSQGITLKSITYKYPGSDREALFRISTQIEKNSSFAIVGPSGSGKSTLVDVILGLISPQEGSLNIFGLQPKSATLINPGKVAYVPQNVYLTPDSIIENICLGINTDLVDQKKVWGVLEAVGLDGWITSLREGVYTAVGERGSRLSGGQKQRLGIARALYQDPLLLVLDEATSSLDADSENEISLTIESLKTRVTVIIIAHRLSTVMGCDRVAYLRNGQIVSEGTFNELRRAVPDFDRQANLMGISK